MSLPHRTRHRFAAVVATACAGLALASAAEAVDLRDWGRKFPTSERFVVLAQFNNEAVLDKETQLVWQRASGPASTWTSAETYCFVRAIGGRLGWRLPSISELTSLAGVVGSGGVGGYLPAGHPFQNIGAQDYFWTSTEYPPSNYSTDIYVRTKALLLLSFLAKKTSTDVSPVLCVRGPT
jgi:hypothetical protein